jgi:hypothetical protein
MLALLRLFVAMLRVMLRLFSRKLLILKQCYMLRFFENVYGGADRQDSSASAKHTTLHSR